MSIATALLVFILVTTGALAIAGAVVLFIELREIKKIEQGFTVEDDE